MSHFPVQEFSHSYNTILQNLKTDFILFCNFSLLDFFQKIREAFMGQYLVMKNIPIHILSKNNNLLSTKIHVIC